MKMRLRPRRGGGAVRCGRGAAVPSGELERHAGARRRRPGASAGGRGVHIPRHLADPGHPGPGATNKQGKRAAVTGARRGRPVGYDARVSRSRGADDADHVAGRAALEDGPRQLGRHALLGQARLGRRPRAARPQG